MEKNIPIPQLKVKRELSNKRYFHAEGEVNGYRIAVNAMLDKDLLRVTEYIASYDGIIGKSKHEFQFRPAGQAPMDEQVETALNQWRLGRMIRPDKSP